MTVLVQLLPTDRLSVDRMNVRDRRGDLDGLAASIGVHGVLVPLIVRPDGPEDWKVVDGGCRLLAAQRAGLDRVPCIVRGLDDRTTHLTSLTANVQRTAMDPIEEASAYRDALDRHGLTQAQLAEAVGVSQGHISRILKLLHLDPVRQAKVAAGAISVNQALAWVPKDPRRTISHDYPDRRRQKRASGTGKVARKLAALPDPPTTSGPRRAAPPGTTLVPVPNDLLGAAAACADRAGVPVGAWICLAIRDRANRRRR